jgi:hypothetical protein
VHLASALAIGDPDLIIAVWDRRLHAAAAAGLQIAPADLHRPDLTTTTAGCGPHTRSVEV